MGWSVVFFRLMTADTEGIPGCDELHGVRVVTVGAPHPMHPALQKRAVDIDFLADLAIGLIKAFG